MITLALVSAKVIIASQTRSLEWNSNVWIVDRKSRWITKDRWPRCSL